MGQGHGCVVICAGEDKQTELFREFPDLLFTKERHQVVCHNPQNVEISGECSIHNLCGIECSRARQTQQGRSKRVGILIGFN